MMDANRVVCGPTPSHLLRTFSLNLFRYGDLLLDESWQTLIHDVADLLNAQLGTWRITWTSSKLMEKVDNRSLESIIRCIYEEEACANGKSHIFIKENKTYLFLPYLLAEFPDSKFIFLIRDPRDMALSWKLSANHPGNVKSGATVWHEDQRHNILVHSWLNSLNKSYLLRYEDLIQNPEQELHKICKFLSIDFDPQMLEFHQQSFTIKNANLLNDWMNLSKPVMTNNKKKYLAALEDIEIRYVEALCKEEMEYFGYPVEFTAGNVSELSEELAYVGNEKEQQPQVHTQQEIDIRKKRLDTLHRIINRKPQNITTNAPS